MNQSDNQFFRCEDVRIKDGILPKDGTLPEDTAILAINRMDSLSTFDTRSPSPANSGSGGRGGQRGGDWLNSGRSWADNEEWNERSDYRGPKPRPPLNQNTITCFNCNNSGHMSRDCPREGKGRDRHNRGQNKRRYGNRDKDFVWGSGAENRPQKQWSDQTTTTSDLMVEISKPNLFPQLKNYYLNQSLSDVSIDINGQILFGHKFVLSAKSDVFKELLFNDISKDMTGSEVEVETDKEETEKKEKIEKKKKTEKNEKIVTEEVLRLVDIDVEAFKLMLKFLYFEDLRLKEENDGNYQMAIEVLKLSKRFRIERLSTLMENQLIEWLEIDNFVDICKLSIDWESIQLNQSLKDFISKNERNIIEKKLFINESIEVMTKILESMRIQKSIIDALTLVLESNPKIEVSSLKSLIDFKDCSIEDIDVLKKIGLFDEKELFGIVRQKYEELLNEKKSNYY